MVAHAARPPEVSFQGRSACTRGQVEVGMGAGGAGPSSGLLGKLLLKKVSEVRCSQEPTWQRGGRICDRAEGLEVPLSRVPWLWWCVTETIPHPSAGGVTSVSPAGGQEKHVINSSWAAADAGGLPWGMSAAASDGGDKPTLPAVALHFHSGTWWMSEYNQGPCQAADLWGATGTALAPVPGRTVQSGDVPPLGKTVEPAASQWLPCVQSSARLSGGPFLAPLPQCLVAQDSQGPWRKLGLPFCSAVSLPVIPNLTTCLCASGCLVFGSCHFHLGPVLVLSPTPLSSLSSLQ